MKFMNFFPILAPLSYIDIWIFIAKYKHMTPQSTCNFARIHQEKFT